MVDTQKVVCVDDIMNIIEQHPVRTMSLAGSQCHTCLIYQHSFHLSSSKKQFGITVTGIAAASQRSAETALRLHESLRTRRGRWKSQAVNVVGHWRGNPGQAVNVVGHWRGNPGQAVNVVGYWRGNPGQAVKVVGYWRGNTGQEVTDEGC